MTGKRSKTDPTEDFDDLFEGIGGDSAVKKPVKSKASAAPKSKPDTTEQDILAELENQLVDEKPSQPHTPRIRETASRSSLPSRPAANTPPPPQGSEERGFNPPRKSGESTRSYHASFTPSATSSELQEPEKKVAAEPPSSTTTSSGGGGGGWWGGLLSTATAAMKQAEAAAKAIQQNEEAKKWTEQVRGLNVGSLNVGALKGLSKSGHNQGCGVILVGKATLLTWSFPPRRRTPSPRLANLYQHPRNTRPSHLLPRTPSDTHYPRHVRIPIPRPLDPRRLQPRHEPGRGW